MATRGVIARKTANGGFKGVYHHWDSNPEGLGQTLFELYKTHFKEDLEAMLKFLIDDHPAGWSTINDKDFTKPAGFYDMTSERLGQEGNPPMCYCHGDRNEKAWETTDKNASGSGCEWAYVFDTQEKTMRVMSSYRLNGNKMIGCFGSGDENAVWKCRKIVQLERSEPNWEKI